MPQPPETEKNTKTYNYKGIYKVSKQLKKLVKEQWNKHNDKQKEGLTKDKNRKKNEIGNQKTQLTINTTKTQFFWKTYRMDKPLKSDIGKKYFYIEMGSEKREA